MMKKILITGAGSYVGERVQEYLSRWQDRYQADTVDMVGEEWKKTSFSGYDAVLHLAAIVHQPQSKDDPAQAELYDRVNHRLAVEVAAKAKAEGVRQFLFMSSESVYGVSAAVGQTTMITKDTPLNPKDNYGISKKKAEEGLQTLADESFKLAVMRPPMIYGKGCKGNYQTLAKLAKKLPVFPWVDNRRSMLYVENFAEFVRLLVEREDSGVFCPQDGEYINTSEMVQEIAKANGKKICMIPGFTWALKLMRHVTGLADKAFGSLCYDRSVSDYPENYCVKTVREAIAETERN